MENQNVKGGWSKATLVFGIIAMVMVILPLISGWFVFLMPVNWCIIIPAGVICAIVALIKKQNLVKTIIGVALCVLAWFMPDMLVEQYAESLAGSVQNAVEGVVEDAQEAAEEAVEDAEDYSWSSDNEE